MSKMNEKTKRKKGCRVRTLHMNAWYDGLLPIVKKED